MTLLAGQISLLRSFASMASTSKDRARALALMAGAQSFSGTVGPAVQIIFTPLGAEGVPLFSGLKLSMYTAPAFLGCILSAVSLLVLLTAFRELYAGLEPTDEASGAKLVVYNWRNFRNTKRKRRCRLMIGLQLAFAICRPSRINSRL